jgi:DNA-binding CsgD family transcriptional regulator
MRPLDAEGHHSDPLWQKLTPQERLVVQTLITEATGPATAAKLHISKHTVHRHLANIHAKLEVHHVTQIIALAVRSGWR